MHTVLKRWYRWFTNPNPIPGQTWKLDGIGLVTITHVVRKTYETCVWYLPYSQHVISNGYRLDLDEFRSQAELFNVDTREQLLIPKRGG